ncbi:hypothetical protein [Mycoplasma sp. 4423]
MYTGWYLSTELGIAGRFIKVGAISFALCTVMIFAPEASVETLYKSLFISDVFVCHTW